MFAALVPKLAEAAESASEPLAMLTAQLEQAQAENAAAGETAKKKQAVAKAIADQIATLQAQLAIANAEQKALEEAAAAKSKAVAAVQAAVEKHGGGSRGRPG